MKRFLLFALLTCIWGNAISQTIIDEGFEGPTSPPEGWTTIYSDPAPPTFNLISYDNLTKFEGEQSIKFSSYSQADSYDAYLITKELNISEEGYSLSFWYKNAVSDEVFKVGLSSTGKDVENDFTWGEETTAIGAIWSEYRIENIPAGTKHVCIHYYSNYKHYLFVDQFKISKASSMTFQEVEVSQTTSGEVRAGTENAGIISIKMLTEGASEALKVSQMKFNTIGTTNLGDISKAKLFFTGGSDAFSDANMIGSFDVATEELNFTDFEAILNEGYNYFWLRYDINPEAESDNFLDGQALEFTIADELKSFTEGNPEGAITIKAPLNGTFLIAEENGDFKDLSDAAIYMMMYGVSGPTVINIADGTYLDRMNIPNIVGNSLINTITFQSLNEDPSKVIIRGNSDMFLNYTIRLEGSSNIHFKNLTFTFENKEFARLIEIAGGSKNIVFDGNHFMGAVVTGVDPMDNFTLINSDNSYDEEVEHNLSFINNTFENGYVALKLAGISPYDEFEENLLIHNNTFKNQAYKSIFIACQNSAVITNNTITANNVTSEFDAISSNYCTGALKIDANKIEVNSTNTFINGIFLQNTELSSGKGIISNNMISLYANENPVYGFWCQNTDNISFINNSINILGEGSFSQAAKIGIANKNFTLQNNILANQTEGHALEYISTQQSNLKSDYNCIYSPEGSFIKLGDMNIGSIEEWQTQTDLDNLSHSIDPEYVGDLDLHTNNSALMFGKNHDLVSSDFDGEERSGKTTMVGADQIESMATAEYKLIIANEDYAIEDGSIIDFGTVIDIPFLLFEVKNTSDKEISVKLNKVEGGFYPLTTEKVIAANSTETLKIFPDDYELDLEGKIKFESEDLGVNIEFTLKGRIDALGIIENNAPLTQVYPNPSNGSFKINITEGQVIKRMTISTIQGSMVNTISNPQGQIQMNGLSAGIYLIQVESAEKAEVIKLIVK